MNPALANVPDRILDLALGALAQANTHSVFTEPGAEHRATLSVLNTAHAGELVLKAIVAKEHPLLLFRDLFSLDDKTSDFVDLEILLKKGRTHDFDKLPQVLWAATGIRLPDMECFERLRSVRNAAQHFCAMEAIDHQALSLEFIYKNIDPLLAKEFGLYAIEYHEDFSVGYDYVVQALLQAQLKFSIPVDFNITEIDLNESLKETQRRYQQWFRGELRRLNKSHLLGV